MTTNNKKLSDKEIEAHNSSIEKLNKELPNFCTPIPPLKKGDEVTPTISGKTEVVNNSLDNELPNFCFKSPQKAESEINKIRAKSKPQSSPSNLYLSNFK